MSTLTSSALILSPVKFGDMPSGTDQILSHTQLTDRLTKNNYQVLALDAHEALKSELAQEIHAWRQRVPTSQLLVFFDASVSSHQLKSLCATLSIHRLIKKTTSEELEKEIIQALELARALEQEAELAQLVAEQRNRLKSLYQELEDRVDKRQKFLLEARRKTYIANTRWELTKEAMMAIHKAMSIGEMEAGLAETLNPSLELQLVRIFFRPQDQMFATQQQTHAKLSSLQVPLFRYQESIGSVFFIRDAQRPFSREESDFLLKISEAVSLALDRLGKLEQSENLKEQWQVTFNSVGEPISLINDKYEIVQTNIAFLRKSGLQEASPTTKCYEALFRLKTPCKGCSLGKNFRLENKTGILDVYSQPLQNDPEHGPLFVNLYHDVTDEIKMERKIVESAKLAEMGTIGSSIAHELNNPLGGILSFIQLIKADLKTDDPLYPDVVEMEKGVFRCRDIIQNLLSFTRDPMVDSEQFIEVKEAVQRAVKIVELQTKSKGIDIRYKPPEEPCQMRGHFNLLSQAIKNILQISIDSILEHSLHQPHFRGLIEVRLVRKHDEFEIQIMDNGPASTPAPSLGLSVAQQIFNDHHGNLEYSFPGPQLTLAKISLPRPVLQA